MSPAQPPGRRRRLHRAFGRQVGLVGRREYLRTVRRRGFILGTLLLPIGFALYLALSQLAASAFTGALPDLDTPLLVANRSELPLAADPEAPNVRVVPDAEARSFVESGQASEVYVIAEDYLSTGEVNRISGEATGLQLDALARHEVHEAQLAAYLRRAVARIGELGQEETDRLVHPISLVEQPMAGGAPQGDRLGPASFAIPYAFSTLFVLSIFITSGYLLQSVTEEKENRVVEIVLSSVPALPLMTGKIIGLGAAGLTQVLVWIATALLALPVAGSRLPGLDAVRLGPEIVLVAILYFVLGYVAYGAIFSAIGALAPGTREAQQYSGFFGIFAVIPLIFTAIFLTDIDSPIVTALSLFPLTAPASILQVVVLAPEPPWLLIGLSLALLTTFTILATIASARVFRATLLLYGTRPSVAQVARAILARG
jgi:ABC-2 type transport system permease protein